MLTVGISKRDKRRRVGLAVLNKSQVAETGSNKYYTVDDVVDNSFTDYDFKLLWPINKLFKETEWDKLFYR